MKKIFLLVTLLALVACSQRYGISVKSGPAHKDSSTDNENTETDTPSEPTSPPTSPVPAPTPEPDPVVITPEPEPVPEPVPVPNPEPEPPTPPTPPTPEPPAPPEPPTPPVPTPVDHTQNFTIDENNNNKVDILIVIDNSESMAYEQQSMAKRMKDFIDIISPLDWQIGLTTTDPGDYYFPSEGTNGTLLPLKGKSGEYILKPKHGNDAQAILGNTIQRKEFGSGEEQGIYTTYRAIERSFNAKSNNSKLFRPDADLATIVISDEDETYSDTKNKPEELLKLVKKSWPQKNFTFHSIITRPGDNSCHSDPDHSYGYTYDKMSRLTGFGTTGGSIIGSVCEKDYANQLKGIGQSVGEMTKVWELTCDPVGYEKNIQIKKDDQVVSVSYRLEKNKIILEQKIPAGQYTVHYQCVP